MDIEKWIEDHMYMSCLDTNEVVIDVGDLRELLKTHVLVPKEESL